MYPTQPVTTEAQANASSVATLTLADIVKNACKGTMVTQHAKDAKVSNSISLRVFNHHGNMYRERESKQATVG